MKLFSWAIGIFLAYQVLIIALAPKNDLSETNGLPYLLAPLGFYVIYPLSFLMFAYSIYKFSRSDKKTKK